MKLMFEDNREVPVEEFDSVLNSTEKFYNEYFRKGGEPMYAGVHGPAFLEAEE